MTDDKRAEMDARDLLATFKSMRKAMTAVRRTQHFRSETPEQWDYFELVHRKLEGKRQRRWLCLIVAASVFDWIFLTVVLALSADAYLAR